MDQLPGHNATEDKFGEARRYVSSNGSSLEFASNGVCYTLTWTTDGPPVLALRTVLQRELTENRLTTVSILYGRPTQTRVDESGSPDIVQNFFDLTDSYERRPNDPATQFDSVRFDLPPRAIMLAALDPDFSFTGMCYLIHADSPTLAADVQAMRWAFLETAEESLVPELDWALGPNLRLKDIA